MKILIVSQYFWPETFIINDLAKTLKGQGNEVIIATGKPNYPEGRIYDGYHERGVQKEFFDDDIEVVRIPLRPRGDGGAKSLFINYLSFVFSGLRRFPSLFGKQKYDAILVFGLSPITMAIPAIYLKWKTKSHLAIWVQDLWPQSLSATGFVKNRVLLQMVGWMVRAIYWCSDTVLVQSEAFVGPIQEFVRPSKVFYYPNSLDSSGLESKDKPSSLPEELVDVLKTNFCMVFAGNIGRAQSIETLLEAAVKLEDIRNFKMVFVGSGSMLDWLREQVSSRDLKNVYIAGRFPPSDMPEIYRYASCLVVSLRNEEIFSYTVPCKVQSYLASGKPIIAALNGEGARVVTEAKAGLACEAENPEMLAKCVRELYAMPKSVLNNMGVEGQAYFDSNFEMKAQAMRLVEILESRRTESGVTA